PALPDDRQRRRPAPERPDEGLLPPAASGPAVGPGAAGLQLPPPPHDELVRLLRRARDRHLVDRRPPARADRDDHRVRHRRLRRPQPDLPGGPLPHRRHRRHPRGWDLGARRPRRVPGGAARPVLAACRPRPLAAPDRRRGGRHVTKAVVLGRRRKGKQIGLAVRHTRERLEAAGWAVSSAVVAKKKELRKSAAAAVKDGAEVVVAVGGDGAVLQVVNALPGGDRALGIVPKGTGNLLAGNLGLPTSIDKAIDVLVGGRRRRIDLGQVTIGGKKRDFAVACGIGFDAVVMDGTAQSQKRRWGKLAYVATAVREGRKVQAADFTVVIDGRTVTAAAAQVFIANFGRIGSLVEPRRRVIPDDGLLDVIIVKASGPVEGLIAGFEALRQKDLGESDGGRVIRARGREVAVSASPRQLVETDGSIIGQTPVKAEIRPDAWSVFVPARR